MDLLAELPPPGGASAASVGATSSVVPGSAGSSGAASSAAIDLGSLGRRRRSLLSPRDQRAGRAHDEYDEHQRGKNEQAQACSHVILLIDRPTVRIREDGVGPAVRSIFSTLCALYGTVSSPVLLTAFVHFSPGRRPQAGQGHAVMDGCTKGAAGNQPAALFRDPRSRVGRRPGAPLVLNPGSAGLSMANARAIQEPESISFMRSFTSFLIIPTGTRLPKGNCSVALAALYCFSCSAMSAGTLRG